MKTLLTVAVFIAVIQAYPARKLSSSDGDIEPYNVEVDKFTGRIINGTEAKHGQFPFQAALYFSNGQFCAGSLISTRWVLTTATCASSSASVTVHLGAHNLSAINTEIGRVIIQTSEIILYHSHNMTDPYVNNIALINLGEDVHITRYIQAVPLASGPNMFVNTEARLSGWGENSNGGMMSSDLKYVDLNVTPECKFTLKHDSILCAAGETTGGFCLKDKGGALIDLYSGKQIGIASFFSANGCDSYYASGFTRITYFTSWITANTGIQI